MYSSKDTSSPSSLGENMEIILSPMMSGRTNSSPHTILISKQATVFALKSTAALAYGTYPEQINLVCNGRLLREDLKKVQEYGVVQGRKVVVTLSHASGNCNSKPKIAPLSCGTVVYSSAPSLPISQVFNYLGNTIENGSKTKDWTEILEDLIKLDGNYQDKTVNSPEELLVDSLLKTCSSLNTLHFQLSQQVECLQQSRLYKQGSIRNTSSSTASLCHSFAVKLGLLGATLSGLAQENPSVVSTPNCIITTSTSSVPEVPFQNNKSMPKNNSSLNFVLKKSLEFHVLPIHSALNSISQHDHVLVPYESPKIATLVLIETILNGLAQGAGFLLLQIAESISDTFKELAQLGYDAQALVNAGRLVTVPIDAPNYERMNVGQRTELTKFLCQETLFKSGCSQVTVVSDVAYRSGQKSLPLVCLCLCNKESLPSSCFTELENSHPVVLSAAS